MNTTTAEPVTESFGGDQNKAGRAAGDGGVHQERDERLAGSHDEDDEEHSRGGRGARGDLLGVSVEVGLVA